MLRVSLLAALLVAGCARPDGRTVAVRDAGAPEDGGFRIAAEHLLTATDSWERAQWVEDGPAQREEIEQRFAGRPRAQLVRVEAVERDEASAVVTARVNYSDGTAGVVQVALRSGAPARLVDWPATRELAQ